MKREEAIILISNNRLTTLTKRNREEYLMDWWVQEKDDLEMQNSPESPKLEIPESLMVEIEENEKYENPEDSKYNPLIILGLYYEYRGVKSQYVSSETLRIKKENIIVKGQIEVLEKCPCCGNRTLDQKCDWDICKVCFWEDDCTSDLDKISGPNHITWRKAKANFLSFGACKKKALEFVENGGKLKYEK